MSKVNLYDNFLESKKIRTESSGFELAPNQLNPNLFDWQKEVVAWALKQGRAALFEDCGLGKSPQSLEWANQVHRHVGGDVLILTPLAVAPQFADEAEKFGIEARVARSQTEVKGGITITNYEMLDSFKSEHFAGVVLDESSILKSFMGQTKQKLMKAFSSTPYRLCCTATPSPNDQMELCNTPDFLGIMPSDEILGRWFINDTMNFGKYRLKGHAANDYWEWVASWAMCLSSPTDLGYDGSAYVLPELNSFEHCVDADLSQGAEAGTLYRTADLSATGLHKELRITSELRCRKVAEIVNSSEEAFVVWCEANYDADLLVRYISDAIEIRGSQSVKEKERKLKAFADGSARVIISKPSICGYGLNWQHCRNQVATGFGYSYEQPYQALRRLWRFGQRRSVNSHSVLASTERAILHTVRAKEKSHENMKKAMTAAISRVHLQNRTPLQLRSDPGTQTVQLPNWLKAA